jgi:hypothetical protein
MNRALLWGGTGFNFGKKPERMQAYIDSTARTREVAKQQGIDVFISNHNAYDGSVEKRAVKGSDGPNPFVLGAPTVQRALTAATPRRFRRILIRMALRVPEPKMLDITPAGRIWSVVARVVFRGRAEQLLPTPPALELVGVLHGVACLMTENGHALRPSAALDIEHHFLLDLHQAGMCEIEWDGNAGHVCRTKPFARYPCVRPQPDAPLLELFIESAETILEPSVFDRNPQTTEALFEQLFIR